MFLLFVLLFIIIIIIIIIIMSIGIIIDIVGWCGGFGYIPPLSPLHINYVLCILLGCYYCYIPPLLFVLIMYIVGLLLLSHPSLSTLTSLIVVRELLLNLLWIVGIFGLVWRYRPIDQNFFSYWTRVHVFF